MFLGVLVNVMRGEIKMKENLDHLPKECEVCGEDIENIHRQYRSMGFCEKHWCENADALWEEFTMTREACR